MKLASIILPLLDNEGSDLFMEHQHLKHDLMKRWHGYTAISTTGGWSAGNGSAEQGVKYEVAMPLGDVITLRELAAAYARACRQEAVMMVTPNGDVEFVRPLVRPLEKIA